MDQYVDNRNVEILQKLLADPAEAGQYYSYNLQSLIGEYPQSGILRALLAHTNKENQENLHAASARFNSRLLYKLINAPESLPTVNAAQVIFQTDNTADRVFHSETLPEEVHETVTDPVQEEVPVAEQPVVEAAPVEELELPEHVEPAEEHVAETEPETIAETEPEAVVETEEEAPVAEETVTEEIALNEEPAAETEQAPEPETTEHAGEEITTETPIAEQPVADTGEWVQPEAVDEPEIQDEPEPQHTETEAAPIIQSVHAQFTSEPRPVTLEDLLNEPEPQVAVTPSASSEIEDEVYDEIAGIESVDLGASKHPEAKPAFEATDNKEDIRAQEDKLITENMVATDYFVFEKVFDKSDTAADAVLPGAEESSYFTFERELDESLEQPSATAQVDVAVAAQNAAPAEEDQPNISKYFDDKLPYTFLWWLDKTRQEHADLYQPYSSGAKSADIKTFGDPRLQQLYYESIFQVSPPEEIGKQPLTDGVEFDMTSKADRIIGRFIQEDPQIRTPSNDKLDNENKAKKSSEDNNELVTETLAKIYTEQMLYHKAIATYKKLMLKFPEKSRYFADHIENLEKKIN